MIVETGLAVAGVAAVAAVGIHDFFEGETLLHDLLDEYRLSSTSLEEMDRRWAANTSRSSVIISLTTIPSRLPHIAPTLKSLMRQTRAPASINLNLPHMSIREKVPYAVPAFLQGLGSVKIHRCDDMGPATKVVPTLQREKQYQAIIVVDDDRIYPSNLVADLEDAAAANPGAAFGMSGWRVPPDLVDRPSTIVANFRMQAPSPVRARRLRAPYAVDILQGLSGYIVRPGFFNLTQLVDYSGAPRESFYVDDVWISGHCKVPRFVIPSRRYNYQPKRLREFYKGTSLGLINRGTGGNERRHNTVVMKHLAERWQARPGADEN